MKKLPRVSPAEFKILEILWANSPQSASQIVDALVGIEAWQSRTIKSLVNRLMKKNIIGFKQSANRYLYYPLLKKEDYILATSHSLIHRIFGGKLSPLVAHFAKHEKISKEDIQELKTILEDLDSND